MSSVSAKNVTVSVAATTAAVGIRINSAVLGMCAAGRAACAAERWKHVICCRQAGTQKQHLECLHAVSCSLLFQPGAAPASCSSCSCAAQPCRWNLLQEEPRGYAPTKGTTKHPTPQQQVGRVLSSLRLCLCSRRREGAEGAPPYHLNKDSNQQSRTNRMYNRHTYTQKSSRRARPACLIIIWSFMSQLLVFHAIQKDAAHT